MVYTYMLSPYSEATHIYRYNKFFPFLYPWKTAEYVKEFAKDGIKGWFCEINLQQHMLECYLSTRITYDASVNTDKLIEDYFRNYYGKAGPAMKKFYKELEKICWDPANMSEGSRNKIIKGSYIYGYQTERRNWHYGTPERMKMFQGFIDEARKAASTQEERARVERFYNQIWKQAMEGRKEFERREKNRNKPVSQTLTKRIPSCNGDLSKVPFELAAPLPEWRTLDGGNVNWKPDIRMLSDDKYIYIRYEEKNTDALKAATNTPFWENNMEIFLAKRAGSDYFQIAAAPSGKHEMNIRTVVNGSSRKEKIGSDVIRLENTRNGNTWIVKASIPIRKVPGFGPEANEGETICGNIYRTDFRKWAALQSYSWSPIYTNDYHEGMLKPGLIFLTPEQKKQSFDLNGAFNVQPNAAFPEFWRELLKKGENGSLTAKDGVMDFGSKTQELKRYRYLLSTKKFPCQEGDTVTVRYSVKGKGLFAPGMYFYHNIAMGLSFLEHKRTEVNSPDKFVEMKTEFAVKSRPGKIPAGFMPMFYAFPGTKLELKDISVSVTPAKISNEKFASVATGSPVSQKTEKPQTKNKITLDVNGSFRMSAGAILPDQWKELKSKGQTDALSAKNGVVDFGTKPQDLKRYRYLLQTKRFDCKEGEKITVRYSAKGKGLFAPGMYFYYDPVKGHSFLEYKRTNLNSPDQFTDMEIVFTVKSRPNQKPEKIVPMFYAFPGTKLELKNITITKE